MLVLSHDCYHVHSTGVAAPQPLLPLPLGGAPLRLHRPLLVVVSASQLLQGQQQQSARS